MRVALVAVLEAEATEADAGVARAEGVPPALDSLRMELVVIIELARETRFDAVDELLVTRAVEPDSRGKSTGLVEGRRDIIEEYADCYEQYPTARRRAVADTARVAGAQLLRAGERREALGEFWRAFRTQPTPARAVPLVAALGGWRSYRASEHLTVRLQ